MLLCGIDPGLSGALCFYDSGTRESETIDMPTLDVTRGGKAKRDIDAHALSELFWRHHAGHAFVEQVGAMPGQGTSSMFAFGKSYGVVLGVLAAVGVPYTLVPPAKWKRALSVVEGKDAARSRAKQLLPQAADQWPLKKDHGKAEAALIAYYGHRQCAAIATQLPPSEDADGVASAALAEAANA